ncbi:hypothetical protein DFH29DRAFT_193008 [Suillus ampliporus]|nr:hypothetical protein DFH29DRAFT_193008 [Suillus ampliporus]
MGSNVFSSLIVALKCLVAVSPRDYLVWRWSEHAELSALIDVMPSTHSITMSQTMGERLLQHLNRLMELIIGVLTLIRRTTARSLTI